MSRVVLHYITFELEFMAVVILRTVVGGGHDTIPAHSGFCMLSACMVYDVDVLLHIAFRHSSSGDCHIFSI